MSDDAEVPGRRKMDEQEFAIACLYLQDHQRVIAAGKIQRWDVVKWAGTVNLALASASAFVIYRSGSDVSVNKIGAFFTALSIAVAIIGWSLVRHYNTRMTGARDAASAIGRQLVERGIDLRRLVGDPIEYPRGASYDEKELCIFGVVLAISAIPAAVLWLLASHWSG